MKNNPGSKFIAGAAVALLLAATAIKSNAGPPPDFSNRSRVISTGKEAKAVKADDAVAMVCGACKTALLSDAVYLKRTGAEIDDYGYEWFTVGSKHKCGHCGGEITVIKGKTVDSMQHNCSKCGGGCGLLLRNERRDPEKINLISRSATLR